MNEALRIRSRKSGSSECIPVFVVYPAREYHLRSFCRPRWQHNSKHSFILFRGFVHFPQALSKLYAWPKSGSFSSDVYILICLDVSWKENKRRMKTPLEYSRGNVSRYCDKYFLNGCITCGGKNWWEDVCLQLHRLSIKLRNLLTDAYDSYSKNIKRYCAVLT